MGRVARGRYWYGIQQIGVIAPSAEMRASCFFTTVVIAVD